MKTFFLIVILFFTACHQQRKLPNDATGLLHLNASDSHLAFKNGYWYYHGNPFSGIIVERFADNSVYKKTNYKKGKEEGEQNVFYPGGRLCEKRKYHLGEKDGEHVGWWSNGNKRFEYHFANGVYNGDYREWYESGKPLKHIHYAEGIDDRGKGWRENGKLYMNFTVKNGRRYGLNNSNLCYTVSNGNGEYVVSLKE